MTTPQSAPNPSPDWAQRFREPRIVFAKLASANPDRGLVLTNQLTEAYDLCAWSVPDGQLRPLTRNPDGHNSGWISPDGSHVYFLKDEQGNELGHMVRLPFEGGPTVDLSPDMKPYTLRGTGFSADGTSLAFTAVNKDGFQLCFMDLNPGDPGAVRTVHTREKETWGGPLSNDGKLVAAISTVRAGGLRQYSLLAIDTASGEVIGELWDGPGHSVELAGFAPLHGDTRILGLTTRTGFRRPVVWDPTSNTRQGLLLEDLEGEVMPLVWHPQGDKILICQLHQAQSKLYLYDLSTEEATRVNHPEGTFYNPGLGVPGGYAGPQFNRDGDLCCLRQSSAHHPRVEVIGTESDDTPGILLQTPETQTSRPWRSVHFASSDGQEIQGWLGLPEGKPPFPAVITVHGGPHMIAMEQFDPAAQAWNDEGYAFLSINYRGSAMFGQAFKEKIWGKLGHWEMEDIASGRSWLVAEGLARPDAVFLSGNSYGGYLTLWGLGTRPELWAGGMASVAIADWVTVYEDASDALKGAIAAWHLGSPDEKRDLYVERSPITHAENVRAPVLIIQGKADSRTPARQMELYEKEMKSLRKSIEVDWFDTGHFVMDPEQLIRFQQRKMDFARRALADQ